MGEIYRITCIANGRFYIGSTVNFVQRKGQHLYSLRRGSHFSPHMQRAFKKHGEQNFRFDIIVDNVDSQDLIHIEGKIIRKYHPAFNADQPHPTRLGAKQSDACKAKVSAANKGRKHTRDAKKRISTAMIGNTRSAGHQNARKVTPEIRRRIKFLVGKIGKEKIAKIVGVSKKTVINVVRGDF